MLQYNKLYQSLKKISAEWHAGHVQWAYCWNYLKFYENGSFLSVASNGNIDNIKEWFTIEKFSGQKGTFTIKNGRIDASVPAAVGTLHFDGCALENKLIIRSYNKEINLIENWDEYAPID